MGHSGQMMRYFFSSCAHDSRYIPVTYSDRRKVLDDKKNKAWQLIFVIEKSLYILYISYDLVVLIEIIMSTIFIYISIGVI